MDSSTAWEGRWGMLRADGVRKPVYDAFRLLSELRGERLAAGPDHPHVGGLAAQDGRDVLVLLWHEGGRRATVQVELMVAGLPAGVEQRVVIQGVDAVPGSPDREPGERDLVLEDRDVITTPGGGLSLEIALPRHGIRLVRIGTPQGIGNGLPCCRSRPEGV